METREHILAVAQKLVQQRGFNGFSYADIAEEVGIRKASLHHHFSTKAELGVALMEDFTAQLDREFLRINAMPGKADAKLNAYIAIFRGTLIADRMCMGGMLASEWLTLDRNMLPSLKLFFEHNVEWLTEVISEGKAQKLFVLSEAASNHARLLFSSLEGALLIARVTGDKDAFDRTASLLITGLTRKG